MTTEAPARGRLVRDSEGPVRWIIADNQPRHNAYNTAMWEALPGLIAEAEADPAVRVVILTGAGERAFSAGADISEFEEARTGDAADRYDELNHRAFEAVTNCAKPTIAMIHGFCMGGGLELALCCDIRYAAEGSQYAVPAAKLGIGYNPRWIRPMLSVVSAAVAKEILFTGRRLSTQQAYEMHLISRVLPGAELRAATLALAAEIAANAPLSIHAAKRSVDELSRHPENPDMAELDRLVAACFASEDYAEGRRAFLAKRKPRFVGR